MFLLKSGAESNNTQNREQLIKKGKNRLTLSKAFLLLVIFIVMFGATFWSMQWFLNSVKGFFFSNENYDKNIFLGGLETSAADITQLVLNPERLAPSTSGGDVTNQKTINRPIQEQENSVMSAKSALSIGVWDGEELVLYAKNEHEKLPIASLAKLMTSLIVLERYNLSFQVTIGEGAMKQEGEQGSLKLGQTLSVKDLLYITLIESSNKSAYALASVMGNYKFIDAMNERARQLGLTSTYFVDSTGIRPQSRSTAIDVARLSRYLFEQYPLFREIISLKEFDLYLSDGTFHHKLVNTNKLLNELPRVLGGKTGWTTQAQGCFMLIERDGNGNDYSIHVVFGSEDRFEDMLKLISLASDK